MATFLRQTIDPASRVFRGCAAVALLAFIVLAGGIPVPAGNHVVRQADEFYPCMHNGCGCATAADCWQSCCCYSLSERLVWARKHDVRPPKFAIDEARRMGLALSDCEPQASRSAAPTSCCSAHTVPCCESHKAKAKDCCPPAAGKDAAGAQQSRAAVELPAAGRTADSSRITTTDRDTVLLLNALRCRGVGENWYGLAVATPPPSLVRCAADASWDELFGVPLHDYQPAHHQPPAPPPRYALLCG